MLAKMVDKYVLLKIISMIEEEPLENDSKKTQRDEKISWNWEYEFKFLK